MKKRRSLFLDDYVVNQYPVEDFKELIIITLDIVENFLLVLESDFSYNSMTVSSFGVKYGSSQKSTTSKIESIYIKNLRTKEEMEKFLKGYFTAYKSLNQEEQEIFNASFIDRLTDLEIISKYNTHSKHIRTARRSAIVRFCLRAGLDKFLYVLDNNTSTSL